VLLVLVVWVVVVESLVRLVVPCLLPVRAPRPVLASCAVVVASRLRVLCLRGKGLLVVGHAAGFFVALLGASPCAQAHHTSQLLSHPLLTVGLGIRRGWPGVSFVLVVALPATVIARVAPSVVMAPLVTAAFFSLLL